MKKLLTLLAFGALTATAQGLPGTQPQQLDCRLDAKSENRTGISCTGIEWPPPARNNQPPAGIVDVKGLGKHRNGPTLSDLVRAKKYKGPEPMGVEPKWDRYERAVPRFAPRQIADKKFWILAVGLNVGSSVFDVESMQYGIRRGLGEGNPILGQHRGRAYGIKLGLNALNSFLLYKYKKWDMQDAYMGNKMTAPKWWHVALFWPAGNFGAGIANFVQAKGRPVIH